MRRGKVAGIFGMLLLATVLFGLQGDVSAGRGPNDQCFNSTNGLSSTAAGSFPRAGSVMNMRDCTTVPLGASHVYLSSYFANANGSPGSTLHTPTASFDVFYILPAGQTTVPAQTVTFGMNTCSYGAQWRTVDIERLNASGPPTTIGTMGVDSGWTYTVNLAGTEFVAAPEYGSNVRRLSRPIMLSIPVSPAYRCEAYVSGSSTGARVSFKSDADPYSAYSEPSQRYNQHNWSSGNRRSLGPVSGQNQAVAMRTNLSPSSEMLEYIVRFASPCTMTTNQTIRLRVYDADSPNDPTGGTNPPGTGNGSFWPVPWQAATQYDLRMRIIEYDENGNFLGYTDPTGNSNRVIGGNDVYREYNFTARPGRQYAWHWWNVSANNGLQLWVPFSEITRTNAATCTPPNAVPSGSYSATCNAAGTGAITITANLSDADGGNVTVVTTVNGGIAGMNSNPSNYVGAVGNGRSIGTVTRPPNGSTYTVSGTITDGVIASPVAMTSATVTCPRPPTTWTCTFAVSGGTAIGGEQYLEPSTDFSIVVTINNTSAAYAAGMNNTSHPVSIAATPAGLTGIGPASGYSYSTSSGPTPAAVRTATVTDTGIRSNTPARFTFTVSVGGANCPGASANVGNHSYWKEYGGDVWTGGNFTSVNPSCIPPSGSGGRALGFAQPHGAVANDGISHRGTSTQLTLTALLNINGAYSASVRDVNQTVTMRSSLGVDSQIPARAYAPKGLTFANIGGTQPATTYGGGFGEGSTAGRCITDYFNSTQDSTLRQTSSFPPPVVPTSPVQPQTGVVWADDANTPNRVNVTAGRNYRITVSGTWANVFGSPGQYSVDAYCQQNAGVWQVQNTDLANPNNHDLQIDVGGDGIMDFVTWTPVGPTIPGSPGCSASHTYTYDTGNVAATGQWALRIFDGDSLTNTIVPGWYGDNQYGLNFSATCLNCPTLPATQSAFPAGRSQYQIDNNLTLGELTIPAGSQVAVFVEGNAYINGNITFATGASQTADLPNFALIVCGSIYINSAVTRIDGTLVAQPGRINSAGRCVHDGTVPASSGTIYTCATAASTACTAANVYAQSSGSQLSINGSLVANRIKFLRVRGSLKDGVHGEVPAFATGAGTSAAEVVNFTPQMYLAPSALRTPGLPEGSEATSRGAGVYDAIRALPPIF